MKEEAKAHYERMIKWAETQSPDDKPDRLKMFAMIGENWGAEFCDYCYEPNEDVACIGSCVKHCGRYCCGGLWYTMNLAHTWRDWIAAAWRVYEFIEDRG